MSGLHKFFAADDAKSGGALNADGILDILNDDSEDEGEELKLDEGKPKEIKEKIEETKDEETKVDEETDEEEGDELSEIEDELKDEDEDELELITPVKRKEILAKYPQIFKDFPYLEKAYYREQKYSEIYPSLDDAKKAQEDSQTLQTFENRILSGDISSILSVVKRDNEKAFNKLVDNYLPTLQRTDERAFFHVVNSIVKPIIYKMAQEATNNNNQELHDAARILNQFMYSSSKWEPHKPLVETETTESEKESQKVSEERRALFNERFTTARDDLNTRVEATFEKAIAKHIDPKSEMSDYVRKNAIREAQEIVTSNLSKDTRLRAVLDRAWRKAAENGFDKDSMDNIRRIINARAQTVLPTVIKKARMEALRGMGKRVRNDKDNDSDSGRSTSSTNRGPLKQGQSKGQNANKSEIPKGMSNRDFIMSD